MVASDEIQVNVMQKSVVYWKWPNVVDNYCKRADAIKRIVVGSCKAIVVGSCFKQFKFKESGDSSVFVLSRTDILNIHPFITLSILMVETSYCTYMEAVT